MNLYPKTTLSILAILMAAGLPAQSKFERAMQAAKEGDVKIARKICKRTTAHAIEYYKLRSLVKTADIRRTEKGMYELLKWKMGGATPIAAQWVTAGYRHFEKAYKDEFAGMLLGVIEFEKRQPELKMPPYMQEYLKQQAGQSGEAIAGFLVSQGIPPQVAKLLGDKVEKALQNLIDRNKAGVFWPKKYDLENKLVYEAIKARKQGGRGPRSNVPRGGNGNSRGKSKWKNPFERNGRSSPWGRGGKGNRTGNGSGNGHDNGSTTSGRDNGNGERHPSMESRIRRLELRMARLEHLLSVLASGREQAKEGGSSSEPMGTRAGYTHFKILATNYGKGTVRVAVNGGMVGLYNETFGADLTPFLGSDKSNEISYEVDPAEGLNGSGVKVCVQGYLPSVKKWFTLYHFNTTKKKHKDTIKLPRLAKPE